MPSSLIEAVRYFSDIKVCNDYMRKIKWPDGKPTCPKCGGQNIGHWDHARDAGRSAVAKRLNRVLAFKPGGCCG